MATEAIPEITPEELVRAVEAGREMAVLDVRAPERLANGKIDVVLPGRFFNIKGSELLAFDDVRDAGLDPSLPLAVVCGLGNDSKRIAKYLGDHGYHAASVQGGMTAWMETAIPRELAAPAGVDRFVQFDRIGKGALGYVLISGGEAFVVDPPRHTVRYLEAVDAAGADVVGVADTHAHADYISGGPALARLVDAPYYLHPADAVSPYDQEKGRVRFEPLEAGRQLRFGRAVLLVEHTPGHTEGSVTFRLGECALTGDFVFVRSVGRPDLGGKTEAWTKVLWGSLERAKSTWSADLTVYPAHYASADERRDDRSVGGVFGDLLRENEPLALADEAAFARWVSDRARPFPDAYRKIKSINIGLATVDDLEAEELEAGKNQCALG